MGLGIGLPRPPPPSPHRRPDLYPWPFAMDAETAAVFLCLGVSTIRRECKAGRFPAPFSPVPGRVSWLRADLEAWARSRAGHPAPADDIAAALDSCFANIKG